MGSISNGDGDGDGNENGKKAIGLDWQNNNSAHESRFFVDFFAVVARLRRETPNFTFCGGREHMYNNEFLFFVNLDTVL